MIVPKRERADFYLVICRKTGFKSHPVGMMYYPRKGECVSPSRDRAGVVQW